MSCRKPDVARGLRRKLKQTRRYSNEACRRIKLRAMKQVHAEMG